MVKFNWQGGLVLIAAAISFGCGSDSNGGSASCPSVTGCGGDVVGTWTISSFCLTVPDSKTTVACGAINIHTGTVSASGTITFNADGTQSQNFTIVADATAGFPTSCVSDAAACTQGEATLDGQSGTSDAHCSFSSGSCNCTFKVTTPNVESGTYQTSGTSLTFQNTGEDPETDPYCVSGNKLTLRSSDGDGNLAAVTLTK